MVKQLLILALLIPQPFEAGGALYLCIGSDGSLRCVDSGPNSCTCCHQEKASAADDRAGCCGSGAKKSCGAHCGEPATPDPLEHSLLGKCCDCTHILISQQQPVLVLRSSVSTDADRFTHVANLPCSFLRDGVCGYPEPAWRQGLSPIPIPTQWPKLLSSVALRC